MKENRPCIHILQGIEKRIKSKVKSESSLTVWDMLKFRDEGLSHLCDVTARLSRVDRNSFNSGNFIAGPVHLLVFTPLGFKTIINYEYIKQLLHLPLPSITTMTQGYLGLKDMLENIFGGKNFHNFNSTISNFLRTKK